MSDGYERSYRDREFRDRPRMEEKTFETKQVKVQRKTFLIERKSNSQGGFVRINEFSDNRQSGRPNMVIVPEEGFDEFMEALEAVRPKRV